MFKFKKLLSLGVVTSLAFSLAACGGGETSPSTSESSGGSDAPVQEEEYVLKIAAGTMSPEFSLAKTWRYYEEELEARSDGRINVELYISGELGGDRELSEAVQMGEIQMVAPSTGAITGFSSAFNIFDLPFLFKDRETAYTVLDGEPGKKVLGTLDEIGLKGLGYFENGFRNLTNDVKPIETAADIEGLSVRTMENDMHIEAWRSLGANPTPMSFEELYTALQQGTIDGQENPLGLIRDIKLFEVQSHLAMTNHVYSPYVILMHKGFYDSLPADLQLIVEEVTTDATEYNRGLTLEEEKDARETLEAEGMQITELPAEEIAKIQEKMEPIYDQFKDRIGEDLLMEFLSMTKQ
ncbi:DctP family TRAP transporter solute-binding subunit [Alkalihalobacillus sp. BA299]|uniref:DctP family TRAP transporter solute-binding subunit n=1 Tax=Alkalihalobacillus sp. BA299 TaxID=2815938 RepID=UPI001ADBA183|nr:DctP family TRAP transporter solute-binding subunit [Alkalihalobacillus sp. BA299]